MLSTDELAGEQSESESAEKRPVGGLGETAMDCNQACTIWFCFSYADRFLAQTQ